MDKSTELVLSPLASPLVTRSGRRFGGLTTKHALASVTYGKNLHLFAVPDDGGIVHRVVFKDTSQRISPEWRPVDGQVTDTGLSVAAQSGRLVVCARGKIDGRLHLNEFLGEDLSGG